VDANEPRRREDAKTATKEEYKSVFDFHARHVSPLDPELEKLVSAVIAAAIEVHREPGPGLPECAYQDALSHELTLRGIPHEVEVPIPVFYKGKKVAEGKIDMRIDKRLIIENKVVETLNPVHRAQTIAYLAATELQIALLINWNVAILKDGIKRIIRTP
jgi:GxxExxY protein